MGHTGHLSTTSAGQESDDPVQYSSGSHLPVELRQTTLESSKRQLEQQSPAMLFPSSHCSFCATIPSPQIPLQNTSIPVQSSEAPTIWQVLFDVQLSPSSQTVLRGRYESSGQVDPLPEQNSSRSQIPTDFLQSIEEFLKESKGQLA